MGIRVQESLADLPLVRRLAYVLQGAFQGKRNLYEIFGYSQNISFDQLFFKYLRQDIAGRIVDAPALALWTQPPHITSNNEQWNSLWDDLVSRYNLFSHLERCDKLAGIGRYSILLIGFNDGRDLSEPINTRALTQKTDKILFLQPYSIRSTSIKKYYDNPRSENFMKPELYAIQPTMEPNVNLGVSNFKDNPGNRKSTAFDVHASRVIHIAENVLENGIFGLPRLERVYNTLDDLLKVTGGSAETFWLTANRGIHIDVDKEMEMDTQDAKDLSDEVEEYQHQLRRFIRTRGASVKTLGSDTPDPSGVFKMLVSILSGATGIPQRVLIGSEAGQLASEQDRANWADRIDERRASWGNPYVIFPVIKTFVRAGYLPREESIEITVDWPNSFKMSPLENAQTSAQHARSATNFAKAIETMQNLKMGTPGTADSTLPDGTVVPGTPSVPGMEMTQDLISIDEARKMMWLDKPAVTFDSGADVNAPTNQRVFSRQVKIKQSSMVRSGG